LLTNGQHQAKEDASSFTSRGDFQNLILVRRYGLLPERRRPTGTPVASGELVDAGLGKRRCALAAGPRKLGQIARLNNQASKRLVAANIDIYALRTDKKRFNKDPHQAALAMREVFRRPTSYISYSKDVLTLLRSRYTGGCQ
jgi:hypothetical protein